MPLNSPKQDRVLLDWFNVSYRTLLLGGIVLLVAFGAAALYFSGYFQSDSNPRSQAFAAINEADRLLKEGAVLAEGEQLTQLRDNARSQLAQARAAFSQANYSDARKSAMESRRTSLRLLATARGETGLPQVQFYKLEGKVQVKKARELIWKNADKTTSLTVGDQIKTDSSASAQIIYFNGTVTTIKPGSILEIKELFDDPATRVQKVRETLRTGGMLSSTQAIHTAGSYHEVSTENASITSRGRSEFETRFDELNKGTSIGVYQGKAVVRSGGKQVQLSDRQRISVDAEGSIGEALKLPPTPLLLEPIDQKIFNITGMASATPIHLGWEPIEQAGRFQLQISPSSLFGELMLDRPQLSVNKVTLPQPPPGSYYWRVGFRDTTGLDSAFSETRKFKVISGRVMNEGDTTPPELTIDDFLPFSSQVIARGRTEPGAVMTVNGKAVDVGDDGSFTTIIQLRREGRNELRFVAQDSAGNETTVKKVAFVRPS